MPVMITCQRERIDGIVCSGMSKGFVMAPTDSAQATYKQGLSLCTTCGNALVDASEDSIFLTISEVEEMMQEEQAPQAEAEAGQASLQALASHFNESRTEETPQAEAEAVPQAEAEDTKGNMSSDKPGPSLSEQIAALQAEAQTLRDGAQAILLQAESNPLLKTVLEDAAKKMEKQALAKEKDIAKLLPPVYKVIERTTEEIALRQAIFNGGIEALRAFDAALSSGIIGKKKASPAKSEQGEKPVLASTENRASTTKTPERSEQERIALEMKANGRNVREIAEALGFDDPAYKGYRKAQRVLNAALAAA